MGGDADPTAVSDDPEDLVILQTPIADIHVAEELIADPIEQDVTEIAIDLDPLQDQHAILLAQLPVVGRSVDGAMFRDHEAIHGIEVAVGL
jgi:hypothetical protein